MFKSITYKRCDPKTELFYYDLEDSEFGIVEVAFGDEVDVGVVVAREYSKRYEDVAEHSYAKAPIAEHSYVKASDAYRQGLYAYVGKNLAVAVMWYCETYGYSIKDTCTYQDDSCPEHFPNWKEYAASRDEHLSKLLLL